MTLPTSGPLSIYQINAQFGRGNNLNAYRNTLYYTSSGGPFTFPNTNISISNFYGTSNVAIIPVVFFLTSGSSFVVPSNWNNSLNSIACIGAGGGGGNNSGGGGGGGAYAAKINVTLTPGSTLTYQIGQGGAGQTSYDGNGYDGTATYIINSGSYIAYADYGRAGTGAGRGIPYIAAGGQASNSIGDILYSGGNGGGGSGYGGGGGGGGAAGPNGAGVNGGNGTNGYLSGTGAGGAGDAGSGGAGGSQGSAGSNGTEIGTDGTNYFGSGGGGGGGGAYGGEQGYNAGLYGAGGGGSAGGSTGSPSGVGANGLIIISYNPKV